MEAENRKKSIDDIVKRMIELAEKSYNCSQIVMIMGLEKEGESNPDMIRAMSGLGDGCGFLPRHAAS